MRGVIVKTTFVAGAVLLLALLALTSQGDPCDTATNPQQCRIELPDR
jgi:hypothetical protein